jgi:hypothetical protein
MELSLAKIDTVYQQIQSLTLEERIIYCENLIDRTQNILSKNAGLLTVSQKQSLQQVILVAQKELKKLRK